MAMKYFYLFSFFIAVSFNANAVIPSDFYPETIEIFGESASIEALIDTGVKDANLMLHEIDRVENIEKQLSGLLPKNITNEDAAQKYIEANLIADIKKQKENLANGWNSISRAKMYNLERIPAIVFDKQFIVYGETLEDSIIKYQDYHVEKNL